VILNNLKLIVIKQNKFDISRAAKTLQNSKNRQKQQKLKQNLINMVLTRKILKKAVFLFGY